LHTPFIVWRDEDDLLDKVCRLAADQKLRRRLGDLNYQYCKRLHDERPVAERFLKILEEMN